MKKQLLILIAALLLTLCALSLIHICVRQTGFAATVAAGHNGRIAERDLRWFFVAFEARNGHAGDLKAFDFFHSASLRCLLRDLIAVQRIKCDVSLFPHRDLRVIELRTGHKHGMTALCCLLYTSWEGSFR